MYKLINILLLILAVIMPISNIGYGEDLNGLMPDPAADRATDEAAGPSETSTAMPNIGTSSNNILNYGNNITDQDLRTGNVDMNTIPLVIISIINVLLGIAGTIAIVSLIYYAVQMQINSGITGDSSGVDKAKKGMFGSIMGFILAILAWFIVIRLIEILTSVR